MMERTKEELQRIKDAVLAELESMVFADGKHDLAPRLRVEDHRGKEYGWWAYTGSSNEDWDGSSVFAVSYETPDDHPHWGIAYSVLRLEARAERERAQPLLEIAKSYLRQCKALYESPEDDDAELAMGIIIENIEAAIGKYEKGASHG
jgi:hypothetical protein